MNVIGRGRRLDDPRTIKYCKMKIDCKTGRRGADPYRGLFISPNKCGENACVRERRQQATALRCGRNPRYYLCFWVVGVNNEMIFLIWKFA